MLRKLVLLLAAVGALAFSAPSFAITKNGRVIANPASGPQVGAGRNRNVGGGVPFHGPARTQGGPQVGGPSLKK